VKGIFLFLSFFVTCLFSQDYDSLKKLLDLQNVPKHIAIIMDGNRRWSCENDLSYHEGYLSGANTLLDITKAAIGLNISTLTFFAFSTENWKRSQDEIDALLDLFEDITATKRQVFLDLDVKVDVIGDLSRFSENIQGNILDIQNETKDCKTLDLIFAINYGGRDEIKRAFIKILQDFESNNITIDEIDQDFISSYLDTRDHRDPDLIIRTAKEARLSNFLLWQAAYSEIYLSEKFWPAFNEEDLALAILDYQKRKRRKGT
jgi:undecaprenyl diphosphate synthase